MPRYQSVTARYTLHLLCVSPDGRGRCLEAAGFTGPTVAGVEAEAAAAGWVLSRRGGTAARCPRCTELGRPFGRLEMDDLTPPEEMER